MASLACVGTGLNNYNNKKLQLINRVARRVGRNNFKNRNCCLLKKDLKSEQVIYLQIVVVNQINLDQVFLNSISRARKQRVLLIGTEFKLYREEEESKHLHYLDYLTLPYLPSTTTVHRFSCTWTALILLLPRIAVTSKK